MTQSVKIEVRTSLTAPCPSAITRLSDPPKPTPFWVEALMRAVQLFGFALMLASLIALMEMI